MAIIFVISHYFKDVNPSILLVDDNTVNRKVASEILKKADCKVLTASSGMEAIKLVKENSEGHHTPFDVIFMDIQMPDLDGIETTAELRKLDLHLPPIIAMTAYSMKEDRDRFISNGMDDYLPKPIRAYSLIEKVEEWIKKNSKSKSAQILTSTKPAILEIRPTIAQQILNIDMFDMAVINQLNELAGHEMVASVMEEFEIEANIQIKNALNAFQNEDSKTIKNELHTLKGNAGTLGLSRIYEVSKIIEGKTKVDNFDNFAVEMEILEAEFNAYKLSKPTLLSNL